MSLFRRRPDSPLSTTPAPMDRVTSVLGPETIFKGRLSGSGGVRIEGSFEGEISLDGLLVIGQNGKVTSENITATIVVVAGVLKGNITAEKVEIRSTGRVWGDVTTSAFATQEGAFLRGQIRMEEELELEFLSEEDDTELELEETEPIAQEEAAGEEPPGLDAEPAAEASQPAAALEEEQPTAEADLSGATNGDEQAEEAVIDPDSGAGEEEADEKPKRGRKRTQKKIETE